MREEISALSEGLAELGWRKELARATYGSSCSAPKP
jgi:hypothetical protein